MPEVSAEGLIITRKTYVHFNGLFEPFYSEIESRDVNKFFVAHPEAAKHYDKFISFMFADKIFTETELRGEKIPLESDFRDRSPKFFFPGTGKIFTMADVQNSNDETDKYIIKVLESNQSTEVFIHNTGSLHYVNLKRGDRILDESEIQDFGQKQKTPPASAPPPPDDEPDDGLADLLTPSVDDDPKKNIN